MSAPNLNLDAVFEALHAQHPRGRGGGRAIMFMSARAHEGVTTLSRAAAEAAGSGNVYAIDLDLRRNALARSFAASGALGARIDGRLSGLSFCSAWDGQGLKLRGSDGAFCYHRIGASKLYVGVFDGRGLPKSARLVVGAEPDYWNAARACGACVVIDAPALERSHVGLRIARHMDGVVLVVSERPGAAPAALAAKQQIVAAGGNLIGLVYTNASAPVAAIDRVMRRAS